MTEFMDGGVQQLLKHARAEELIVPLEGYRIHVYGALTVSLTPRA